mmetsp:Transcript_171546/g.544992  ORF Transcript_171546/g.544992 Transcript_171546/m.544992 type:complete len:99 (-) Transcript_171546:265-561(-)
MEEPDSAFPCEFGAPSPGDDPGSLHMHGWEGLLRLLGIQICRRKQSVPWVLERAWKSQAVLSHASSDQVMPPHSRQGMLANALGDPNRSQEAVGATGA